MAKAERIQANQVFDTEEVAPARYVVRVAVGPHADLVVLSLDAPPDYRRMAPSGASFAKLRADHTNCYRIDHFWSGEWSSLALTPTNENFHFVQPLGESGWLLVHGRADRRVVERKSDTKTRIGRSPDLAEAVHLAYYNVGAVPTL